MLIARLLVTRSFRNVMLSAVKQMALKRLLGAVAGDIYQTMFNNI